MFDAAGNLYGSAGGRCQFGCNGTIFRVAPNPDGEWKESVLYTFEGGLDGGFPSALVVDGAGNIFGTTFSGGVTQSPCGTCSTVFELSPSENGSWEKTIHSGTSLPARRGVTFVIAPGRYRIAAVW